MLVFLIIPIEGLTNIIVAMKGQQNPTGLLKLSLLRCLYQGLRLEKEKNT